MEVILLEKHPRLGNLGDVANVKNGYARNYLIPNKKAIRATKENKEIFEARKADLLKETDFKIAAAKEQKLKFDNQTITVIMQASDDGKLYGSVNSNTIVTAVESELGLKISKPQITLDEQIKFVGSYIVKIALYADVSTKIRFIVARSPEEAEVIISGKKESKEPSISEVEYQQEEDNASLSEEISE